MSYGDLLTLTLPTVSVTPSVSAYTLWNEAFQDLADVVSAKVLPNNITWNADLNLKPAAVSYGITGAQRVQFDALAAQLSSATYPATLFSYNGELYYNDAASNSIQITSAGAVTAAAGNITGASYGTSGKEVNWDDANATYRMRSGSATDNYASVSMNDALLNDGSGNFIRIGSPALAADYTLTLPNAVPASNNTLLTMATTGTVTNTGTPTVTSLTTTGAITAGTTITAGSNQDITVSGTGEYNHGNRLLNISALAGVGDSFSVPVFSAALGTVTLQASEDFMIPIPLLVGDTIDQINFLLDPAGGGTKTMALRSVAASGAVTTHETTTSTSTGTGAYGLTVSPAVTVGSSQMVYAYFEAGTNGDQIFGIEVRYSHS